MTDTFQQPAPVEAEQAPEAVELDVTIAAWVEAIRAADTEIDRLKNLRERAVYHVQEAMGDAHEARVGGRPVITWKPAKPSMRLDRKALEKTYGAAVIEQFLRPSTPARPFKVLPLDGA